MSPAKPAFHSIVDLGLRDVGVKNEPRRLAAHFGKRSIPLFVLVVLFVFGGCVLLRRTGADGWVVAAFALTWTAAVFALAFQAVRRAPIAVVKVTAEGSNQAIWLLMAPFLLAALAAVLTSDPLLIAPAAVMLIVPLLAWRGRGRMPALLRKLRHHIAADESVLGDGIGLARGAESRREPVRLIVATDRRVLVAASSRSTERFLLLLDVPYRDVSRFGIEWRHRGRIGELSLTVAGETLLVTSIAPANLLSIAGALHANGVETDDPEALLEAQRAWEEALRRGAARSRLIDRAAMNTREFDRGLWLLLALCAAVFYVNPFGIGLGASSEAVPALLAVPVVCAICGYVSRTTSSLAYLVPLNLLVAPACFFADAGEVIALMLLLSTLATVGLWAGSSLRRGTASPGRRAARGSLRHALSGQGLIRLSGMLLAAMVALVATAGAAGLELPTLRLAVEEVTAERLPVDGRSNLTGGAASLTYTPGPDLRELVTDEPPLAGPDDGARWELRSSFTKGYNVVTLGHYILEPPLDDAAALRDFLADKDRAHSRLAGFRVTHTERVVDGRRGYVWDHGSARGYWYFTAWFPQPVHSVRVECVARRQTARFMRLCAEAMSSLEFR